MSIQFVSGDLFANDHGVKALGHGCNCQGSMGAGIAVGFRERYPEMYEQYRARCKAKPREFNLGDVWLWKDAKEPWVFNLGTQEGIWRSRASYEAIETALSRMRKLADSEGIESIAIPRIGVGYGGLSWKKVRVIVERVFDGWTGKLIVYEEFVTIETSDADPAKAVHKSIDTPDIMLQIDGPKKASHTIALAHGAGAPMDSSFMEFFAKELAKKRGFRVVRFEFPYMAAKRESGKSKPPDREPVLRETWLNVIKKIGPENLVIGGKSMGGRIASLVADIAGVTGLVCLGYPFHPVGKPDKLRVEHLRTIKTPTLIIQGERDSFGTRDEMAKYKLSHKIKVKWMKDGDHSFTPRKSSGTTEEKNWLAAIDEIEKFVK